MDVVVVESPAKAKTINKYLGGEYTVLASYGHVRDLPSKDGSVQPDQDFTMTWEIQDKADKHLAEIVKAVKDADTLYLATDPDREGEAIAWHVREVLGAKGLLDSVPVKRVVFHEVTKTAVLNALQEPRDLDDQLIDAYMARRALDYLVGFTLSPVLWRKLPGSRSAGRVQSVALRIICERELEIESFKPQEYWTIETDFKTPGNAALTARLTHLDGVKLDKFSLGNGGAATDAQNKIEAAAFAIKSVESKPAKRNPQAPFTTSTLQQDASRKLGFSARHIMQVAQRLYEGIDLDGERVGLITYMRTDGINIANDAMQTCREVVSTEFGENYLSSEPRIFKNKAKNAQEAHEAIRPTDLSRLPEQLKSLLDEDQYRLYDLIWRRTLASQMAAAQFERTTIDIASADEQVVLRATGTVQVFDGFLKLYQESKDDTANGEDDRRLPKVAAGEGLTAAKISPEQHFTEPPPRFGEASLVKKLEELGIGRPSTYASTLSVLRDRKYVHMDRNRFHPEDKGRLVTAFLEGFFERYVQYDFTANLEDQLDLISDGKVGWKTVLTEFWEEFHAAVDGTKDLRTTQVLDALNETLGPYVFQAAEPGGDPRACPACENGQLSLKVGKFGAFVGCSNYPECRHTRQLSVNGEDNNAVAGLPRVIGQDPESGLDVSLRTGRFGLYLQLGDGEGDEKPKRAGLTKGMDPENIELDRALALLSLPREVGNHPESGKLITAAIGPYGPYVLHDGKYASLTDPEEVFSIGVNRAVTVIAEAKPPRRRKAEALREVGLHPDDETPITILDGRYGPYIKFKKLNVSLPRDRKPEDITLEEAVDLIAAREAKGPAKKKKKKKKAKKAKAKVKAKTKTKAKKAGTPDESAEPTGDQKDSSG